MKKVLVLFSGGMDSTLALLITLQKYPTDQVVVVSYDLNNNPIQTKHEKVARQNILDYFRDKGFSFETRSLEVLSTWAPIQSNFARSIQAHNWAFLIPLTYSFYNEFDIIVTGYINKDDFWQLRQGFEKMVVGGLEMMVSYDIEEACLLIPQFAYPLRCIDKPLVIDRLNSYDEKLLSMVWWCERLYDDTNNKPCGVCCSCERVKELLHLEDTTGQHIDTESSPVEIKEHN